MLVRRAKLLTFCIWVITVVGHLVLAAEPTPDDADEVLYASVHAICSQVPLIVPDASSFHPAGTTPGLPSLKPLTEVYKAVAQNEHEVSMFSWLGQVIESPSFTKALDECYPLTGPEDEAQLMRETRSQFITKLYQKTALVSFGLALRPGKANGNGYDGQQKAQEQIREIHRQFDHELDND